MSQPINMKKVLFICTGNSCRSQMAEGIARTFGWDSRSAGIEPSTVNPNAIKVMREIGIDISEQKSECINKYIHIDFDFIITLCDRARNSCPVFTGHFKHKIHQEFSDPFNAVGSKEEILNIYREVCNEIGIWIKEFTYKTQKG